MQIPSLRTLRPVAVVVILLVTGPSLHRAPLLAQGCSDAGFCTLHGLKPDGGDSLRPARPNVVKAGGSYGKADFGVRAWAGFVEYGRDLGGGASANAKLGFGSGTGSAGTVSGLSDVFVSATKRWPAGEEGAVSLTAGMKIPIADGNDTLNAAFLPMAYQPGLGTFDLILGAGWSTGGTTIAAGVQLPLTETENAFLAEALPAGSELGKFSSSRKLDRKGDALVRVSHEVTLGNGWSVTPGILPILHLGDDRYTDSTGVRRTIEGSGGLTLNLTGFVRREVGKGVAFEVSAGAPVITRDVGPDGLKRGIVIGVEFSRRF